MNISATEQDLAQLIADALRVSLEQNSDEFRFVSSSESSVPLAKVDLSELVARLKALSSPNETTLADNRSFEVLLRDESPFSRVRMHVRRERLIRISDSDNGMSYEIAPPSNEYLLFLLYKVSLISSVRMLPSFATRVLGQEEPETVFSALRRLLGRFMTIRVTSERNRSIPEFDRFANALLFQFSYNLDAALVPQKGFEDLLRTGRLTRLRRLGVSDIDAPRRHYIADLVYHYQLGVAADNPALQYLSYYHIAEHFFEEVFNEDLVERIKDKITRPDFSYKRKKDIGALIKDISRSLQIRNERITFSEQEALKLTLEKHISVAELIAQLNLYDPSLLLYYKTSKIEFAGADEVDLADTDGETVLKKLAARIYRTRNAIVHSKESDRSRYTPFTDDRLLLYEVPVVRFVGEQIILSTSAVIQ